jgi:hypothetical protein
VRRNFRLYKNTYGDGVDYGEHSMPGNLQALDHEAEAGSAGTEEEYEDPEMGP